MCLHKLTPNISGMEDVEISRAENVYVGTRPRLQRPKHGTLGGRRRLFPAQTTVLLPPSGGSHCGGRGGGAKSHTVQQFALLSARGARLGREGGGGDCSPPLK